METQFRTLHSQRSFAMFNELKIGFFADEVLFLESSFLSLAIVG